MKKPQLLNQNKLDSEHKRLLQLIHYEQEARSQGYKFIAGIDEAGRGPLAGPVVAAACVIPDTVFFRSINDSKQLSADLRSSLFLEITSHPQVTFAVGIVSQTEIDRLNIYQATIVAMLQAVSKLSINPDYLLVDGLALPHPKIPCLKIIKGDTLSQSIAAASVIAKVTRDRLMLEYDEQWPHYGFKNHKGYGTPEHLAAIKKHGASPLHRLSFAPLKKSITQLDLFS